MFHKIVKNITYVSTARIFATVISFGLNIIFIRYLGSAKLGVYVTVITYVSFFAVLMNMGLPTLLLRAGGEDKTSLASKFAETLILKGFLAVVSFILMYGIALLLNYPAEIIRFSMIAFFTALLTTFSFTIRRLFFIHEDLLKEALFVVITPVLHACFILILVYRKCSLQMFFIAFTFEAILLAFATTLIVFKRYRIKLQFNTTPKDWLVYLAQALPFAAIGFLGRLHKKIDVILLSKIRTSTEVGLYGAAYKFVDAALFLPGIISSVLLPVFSSSFNKGNKKEFKETANKMLNICITFVVPVVILLAFFSKNFIPFLYGAEFVRSSALLSILCFTFVFLFPNAVMGTVLYAIKKQSISLYNTIACLVFNATVNVVLIPRFGPYCSAVTAVITQILLFTLNFIFISRIFYRIPYLSLFKVPIVAGFSMALIIYFSKGNVWLSIPASIVIYFGLSFLLGGIKAGDIKGFAKLFS